MKGEKSQLQVICTLTEQIVKVKCENNDKRNAISLQGERLPTKVKWSCSISLVLWVSTITTHFINKGTETEVVRNLPKDTHS